MIDEQSIAAILREKLILHQEYAVIEHRVAYENGVLMSKVSTGNGTTQGYVRRTSHGRGRYKYALLDAAQREIGAFVARRFYGDRRSMMNVGCRQLVDALDRIYEENIYGPRPIKANWLTEGF